MIEKSEIGLDGKFRLEPGTLIHGVSVYGGAPSLPKLERILSKGLMNSAALKTRGLLEPDSISSGLSHSSFSMIAEGDFQGESRGYRLAGGQVVSSNDFWGHDYYQSVSKSFATSHAIVLKDEYVSAKSGQFKAVGQEFLRKPEKFGADEAASEKFKSKYYGARLDRLIYELYFEHAVDSKAYFDLNVYEKCPEIRDLDFHGIKFAEKFLPVDPLADEVISFQAIPVDGIFAVISRFGRDYENAKQLLEREGLSNSIRLIEDNVIAEVDLDLPGWLQG